MNMKRNRICLTACASMALGLLFAPNVNADPPSHAPAWGYRQKEQKKARKAARKTNRKWSKQQLERERVWSRTRREGGVDQWYRTPTRTRSTSWTRESTRRRNDMDRDGIIDSRDRDIDGDGYVNLRDRYPLNRLRH